MCLCGFWIVQGLLRIGNYKAHSYSSQMNKCGTVQSPKASKSDITFRSCATEGYCIFLNFSALLMPWKSIAKLAMQVLLLKKEMKTN